MRLAYGKLANAGQTCIAPDYALVHEDEIGAFTAAYDKAVALLYPNGPASDDYTSIVNDRHHARLTGLIEDARAKGARILEVGQKPGDAQSRPHTMAPMVVLDAKDGMRIMQEEIFGPVLPVLPYRDIDEAIAYVNARPRPLALYYYGRDGEDRHKVLNRTTSGNITINGTLMHYAQDDLPFGGVGPSGMGAYHGVEGFRALSHAKGIFEQGRWNGANLLRAPFGRLTERVLNFMLR
jgi:coniferyl-aldehyde dehydrogenase